MRYFRLHMKFLVPILGWLAVMFGLLSVLLVQKDPFLLDASAGRLALFFGSLIAISGILLTVLLRASVLKPLSTLQAGAERICRGDLKHRIRLVTGDEIEGLAEPFNAMTKRLEENCGALNDELQSHNREAVPQSNLMSGILQNMSSGVMLLDLGGTIRLINRAGAALFLFPPEEMLHRKLVDLVPDAHDFVTAAPGSYHETEIRRGDGGSIAIGFSIAQFSGQGVEPKGTIVIYRDLTEIKSLQAAVQSKQRFAAIGEVVAGVAHEIRNPLFGISSVGQILERELNHPAHLDLVKALLAETARLNHLVEELLLYGRPIPLSLAACDLRQLWEEVAGMHRAELAAKGIVLEGEHERGHALALLDADQIRQVLLNLLRNAIEATAPGGKISVRLLLEDRFIIFRIIDTGTGIAAKNISKVFDLFFTTKSKGTGLGLAICRKIVEDHGGAIMIESREREGPDGPRGTTVNVRLPHRGTMEKLRKATGAAGPGET